MQVFIPVHKTIQGECRRKAHEEKLRSWTQAKSVRKPYKDGQMKKQAVCANKAMSGNA